MTAMPAATHNKPTAEQLAMGQLQAHVQQHIVGQEKLVNRLLITLLADGHLLVEGAPGLAKTLAIKTLSEGIEGDFHRIQFTPDLLPADLTGTEIYRPQDGSFRFQKGPLFHHLVLADEINRAPAKVQSALLEAMGEHQLTIGSKTYQLPELFLVMATQNPLEHEGTYPLPEAQLDRFLMHVTIDYPNTQHEKAILNLARSEAFHNKQSNEPAAVPQLKQAQLFKARDEVLGLHLSEPLEDYIVELVLASRSAERYDEELGNWIEVGASPRTTIALDRCSRAHAWLAGRDYVTPEDIQSIVHDVMRHRIICSYEAEASGIDSNKVIDRIVQLVAVP